ncbi:MAG: response regulator transcription factor [Bacteroidota bacterium]
MRDSSRLLKVLLLEDNDHDTELMIRELKASGFSIEYRQTDSKKDFFHELEKFRPDLVLADYSLPMFNGMHAFRLFREKNYAIPFILVTGSLTEELALECLREGVDDFILKKSFKRLPAVISRSLEIKQAEIEQQKVLAELERSNQELMQIRERNKLHGRLSNREFEILCLIASGKSVKEIAAQLYLSPATVATYRARLLEKMNLRSNVDLTRYAMRNKLID